MRFIFTKRGVLLEPTNDLERGEVIQSFIKIVQKTIYRENHRFKQGKIEDVIELINKISYEKNVNMVCRYNRKKDGIRIDILNSHIKYVPILTEDFKDRYRKGEHLDGKIRGTKTVKTFNEHM